MTMMTKRHLLAFALTAISLATTQAQTTFPVWIHAVGENTPISALNIGINTQQANTTSATYPWTYDGAKLTVNHGIHRNFEIMNTSKYATATLAFRNYNGNQNKWYAWKELIYTQNGKTGIGVTSPLTSLDIKGAFDDYGLMLRDKDNDEYLGITRKDGGTYFSNNDVSDQYFLRAIGTDVDIRSDLTVRGGDIYDNSGDLRINGDENVQISMDYKNEVTTDDARRITFGKNAEANQSGWVELMRIQEDGKVGIGTDAPIGMVDIRGTGTSMGGVHNPATSFLRLSDNNNNLSMDTNEIYSSTNLVLGSSYSQNVSIRNVDINGHEHLVEFLPNGQVGIGTETPIGKLDIRSSGGLGGKYTPASAYFSLSDNNNNHMIFDTNEIYSTTSMVIGSSYVRNISFRNVDSVSHQHLMEILPDGRVGIGTTIPTQKLSVAGTINAEELILEDIDPGEVPDYVFEADYKLRSLEATEAYVKAHKHLPEVPSAAEISAEGLAIKEMNLLLLKKVEELTLHLIQKEQDIDALQQSVHQLQTEMTELKKRNR